MNPENTYSVFADDQHLMTDHLLNVALALKNRTETDRTILIFNDQTGQQVDVDTTGAEAEIQQRYAEPDSVRKVGRPKLGVISREVTLQQKHWNWLDQQSTSASAVIRKLIDQELNNPASESNIMLAKQATDRFMSAMLGNMPNYEEATRALYQGNRAVFLQLIQAYPADLKTYITGLAERAFIHQQ
ncbi:DUF2239 family protein [Acinetobacter sp. WZC-1]|uniref:DUF2239 family protein n=1 Tax=Acinetobacter sp. WZC-1 TaxID=3459034 RepID=UPI00403DBCF2